MAEIFFERPNVSALKKEGFAAVDMHVHTVQSADSELTLLNVTRWSKLTGIGFSIVDHNKIKASVEMNNYKDLLNIPGIEVTSKKRKDFLIYFYDLEELKEFYQRYVVRFRKKIRKLTMQKLILDEEEICDAAKRYNSLLFLAHPFTPGPKRAYRILKKYPSYLKHVDGLEVVNSTLPRKQNLEAVGWAFCNKKLMVGGSDAHTTKMLGKVITAAQADTAEEFLDQMRKGDCRIYGSEIKLKYLLNLGFYTMRSKFRKDQGTD